MFESIPAALASANAIKNIVASMQGFENSAALAEAISEISFKGQKKRSACRRK